MGSSVKALRAADLLVPSRPSFQLLRPPDTALQRCSTVSCASQPVLFSLFAEYFTPCSFISQQQGRWLWFFREIDVYLTWCYQSSSVVLKNEKMKLLQALNSCREWGTAVFLLHCVSFSAPQLNWAKQELSGFACHTLHYGGFPSN